MCWESGGLIGVYHSTSKNASVREVVFHFSTLLYHAGSY